MKSEQQIKLLRACEALIQKHAVAMTGMSTMGAPLLPAWSRDFWNVGDRWDEIPRACERDHLVWMCDEACKLAAIGDLSKADRLIGFIQCWLWMTELATLEEIETMTRAACAASGEAQDQREPPATLAVRVMEAIAVTGGDPSTELAEQLAKAVLDDAGVALALAVMNGGPLMFSRAICLAKLVLKNAHTPGPKPEPATDSTSTAQ